MNDIEDMELFDVFDIRKRVVRLNHFCYRCNKKIGYLSNSCNDCHLKSRWDRPTPKMFEQIKQAGEIAHSKFRSEKQREQFKKIEKKGRDIAHANLSDRIPGCAGYWKGKHFSDGHKQNIADSLSGEKAYQWKGGVSWEPYCILFNIEFKERVRMYWNYRCAECGKDEIENGRRLDVHHVISNNKETCCDDSIRLFVPLCCSCHMKTHFSEIYWERHFKEMIYRQNKDGKCFYTKEEMSVRRNEGKKNENTTIGFGY